MHYIIGDVHGHYDTLTALVEKLPKDAKLIFVGDLIDRGPQSAEVVNFVREGGHLCVLGNHESMMAAEAKLIVDAIDYTKNDARPYEGFWQYLSGCLWLKYNGGIATLESYGLYNRKTEEIFCNDEKIDKFLQDAEWIETLPLHLEIDVSHQSGKPVVISHACIGSVWHLRDTEDDTFEEYALWNRKTPTEEIPIFNVFGHTPIGGGAMIFPNHFANIDTGCYMNKESGFGLLTAYCVETGETVSLPRIERCRWR